MRMQDVNVVPNNIDKQLCAVVPRGLVNAKHVVPYQQLEEGKIMALALADATLDEYDAIRNVLRDAYGISKLTVEVRNVTPEVFNRAVEIGYSNESAVTTTLDPFADLKAVTAHPFIAADRRDLDSDSDIEPEKIWNLDVLPDRKKFPEQWFFLSVMKTAIDSGATDIHIEALRSGSIKFRLRIIGQLSQTLNFPRTMEGENGVHRPEPQKLIYFIKNASTIGPGTHFHFEDGKGEVVYKGKRYDLRLAKNPSINGEELVIRILDTSRDWSLDNLKMCDADMEVLKRMIHKPYGMFLVTGPTGSGKTTTQYAMLKELLKLNSKKILTLEDPPEYQVEGISQVRINPKQQRTWESGLRSFLRQDPDVMMVGEVRDAEVASTALNAALTGHLVLTTLHTNDAPSAVVRMKQMGVEPSLISSTVIAVLAQRLIRAVNPDAWVFKEGKAKDVIGEDWALANMPNPNMPVRVAVEKIPELPEEFYYTQRIPVFEIMRVTKGIKELFLAGAGEHEIKELAIKQGMTTMWQDGLMKIAQGFTTLEALREMVFEEEV